MIVYTQRYGYVIEFKESVAKFLTNLHEIDEDRYEKLKEKIQTVYPHLHEIHTDIIELGHFELLPGDEFDLTEGEGWEPPKAIKDMENKIMEIIHEFAQEMGVELPDTSATSDTANLKGPISTRVFTPQQYVEAMTGECYSFTQEDTIEEIHSLLIDHGEEIDAGDIKHYALNDVETLLNNGSLVVLVDCAGFYGSEEIQQNYQWFEVGTHALNFI